MFNHTPKSTLPQTDEEVAIWFKENYNDLTAANLIGIYECRRVKGETLLDAYLYTLEVFIEICNKNKNKNETNANTI